MHICGKEVLEVKCTFCVKDCLPQEDQDKFCMTQMNGQWILREIILTIIKYKHNSMSAIFPTVTSLFGQREVVQLKELQWVALSMKL